MKRILVILGPNLNMVGIREKGVYGTETAETIAEEIVRYAEDKGFEAEIYQSNHEGDLLIRYTPRALNSTARSSTPAR